MYTTKWTASLFKLQHKHRQRALATLDELKEMALCIIKEWYNVETELQPLLCEVNLDVEYAFSQTALRGHIDRTVKSKWEKLGVSAWKEGEGRETREEERVTHRRQNTRLIGASILQHSWICLITSEALAEILLLPELLQLKENTVWSVKFYLKMNYLYICIFLVLGAKIDLAVI